MIALQQFAAESLDNEFFCRAEDLRLGAAKAINALFGITDDENAGCIAGAAVAAKPCVKGLPLQRIGILKLVDQQMPDARVQPLLHPA